MKRRTILIGLLVLVLLLAAVAGLTYVQGLGPQGGVGVRDTLRQGFDRLSPSAQDTALGTAFTYQGRLKPGGELVTDNCGMAFRLYDGKIGSQVGTAITRTVLITHGLFTVNLGFGEVFTSDECWLGIKVKCSGDSSYADLGRRELTAAPCAPHPLSFAPPWAWQGHPLITRQQAEDRYGLPAPVMPGVDLP